MKYGSRAQRAKTVTVLRTIEIDVEVTCEVTPGEPDHYDRSVGGPGGWSPGCGPEVEILSVQSAMGADLNIVGELSKRDVGSIEDAAIEAMGDADEAAAEDDGDRRHDEARDRRGDERWE